jgi:glycosyltransferase involved in cell wall biosynthesis
MRMTYVYAQPRRELLGQIAAGEAPDSPLLGQNYLPDLGIETAIYDSPLARREWPARWIGQAAWYGREVTLPFELRKTDAVCTTLRNVYPVLDRRRDVFVLNMGLNNTLRRWELEGKRFQHRMVTASLRASACVLCFSQWQADVLTERAGLKPLQAQSNPASVDHHYFHPNGGGRGDYVFAIGWDLGRDYKTLIEAMRGLPYKAIIAARERNLVGIDDIPPNVEIEIYPSFPRLRELYAGARCIAIPTRHEDWPHAGDMSGATVLVEGMAMGKPVIITRQTAWSDYVVDGESALLVDPEDVAAFRMAIERVFGDDDLTDRLGGTARATVEERLTSRHFGERLADIVRSVVPDA